MLKFFLILCKLLVIIGALNWGFIGLLDINLVSLIIVKAKIPLIMVKVVYILVGLSGIVELFQIKKTTM